MTTFQIIFLIGTALVTIINFILVMNLLKYRNNVEDKQSESGATDRSLRRLLEIQGFIDTEESADRVYPSSVFDLESLESSVRNTRSLLYEVEEKFDFLVDKLGFSIEKKEIDEKYELKEENSSESQVNQ